jgi:hypothetical protein
MKSPIDIAWAAGLFEGEGTIGSERNPQYIRLALGMTDRDVVERFSAIFGGVAQTWYPPRVQASGRKRMWYWRARGEAAADALRLMLPFFGERRSARARQALSDLERHVAIVTAERVCPSCEATFRPAYSHASASKVYCSKACANASRYLKVA